MLFLLQRPVEGPSGAKQDLRSFKLILEYIKALPVSFLMCNSEQTSFCICLGMKYPFLRLCCISVFLDYFQECLLVNHGVEWKLDMT